MHHGVVQGNFRQDSSHPFRVQPDVIYSYRGLRSFHFAYPRLLSFHASGVDRIPVSRVSNELDLYMKRGLPSTNLFTASFLFNRDHGLVDQEPNGMGHVSLALPFLAAPVVPFFFFRRNVLFCLFHSC